MIRDRWRLLLGSKVEVSLFHYFAHKTGYVILLISMNLLELLTWKFGFKVSRSRSKVE